MTVTIISFGYGHDQPPAAHLTLDLRDLFRDPHPNPALRNLTGHHQPVIDNVMRQPGTATFLYRLVNLACSIADATQDPVIAIGCVGGRHRSVVIADQLATGLRNRRHSRVEVVHRDVDKPVLTSLAREIYGQAVQP